MGAPPALLFNELYDEVKPQGCPEILDLSLYNEFYYLISTNYRIKPD